MSQIPLDTELSGPPSPGGISQTRPDGKTPFLATRFGFVAGSLAAVGLTICAVLLYKRSYEELRRTIGPKPRPVDGPKGPAPEAPVQPAPEVPVQPAPETPEDAAPEDSSQEVVLNTLVQHFVSVQDQLRTLGLDQTLGGLSDPLPPDNSATPSITFYTVAGCAYCGITQATWRQATLDMERWSTPILMRTAALPATAEEEEAVRSEGLAAGVTMAPTLVARVGGRVTATLTVDDGPITVTEILDLAKNVLAQAEADALAQAQSDNAALTEKDTPAAAGAQASAPTGTPAQDTPAITPVLPDAIAQDPAPSSSAATTD